MAKALRVTSNTEPGFKGPRVQGSSVPYVVYGLGFVVCSLWFVVCGLWFMVYGLGLMVYGFWFLVNGIIFMVLLLEHSNVGCRV